MKIHLTKLHAQRKNWQPHGRLSLYWNFSCISDNAKIDLENTQIMRCILCYQKLVI